MNKILDQILKHLDDADFYVDYGLICDKFKIPDSDRKYILTKLDNDGYIDISRTKSSLEIKISDEGRVFIYELGYSTEKAIEEQTINSIKKGNRLDNFFKISTLLLAILSVYFAYSNSQKNLEIKEQSALIEKLELQISQVDKTIETSHYFSNTNTKDIFKLSMKGENLLASKIEFEIISKSGEQIFRHIFKSEDLIGYGLIEIEAPTEKQKEDFILKRFYSFLDESNFESPAIEMNEKLDSDYYNADYFNIIKNQTNCVSFYYLLGEEYMRRIVYLKKEKKTVEFWMCC